MDSTVGLVVIMACISYLHRAVPIEMLADRQLSERAQLILRFLTPAVLGVLAGGIVGTLVRDGSMDLSAFAAIVVAIIAAKKTRNVAVVLSLALGVAAVGRLWIQ